MKINVHNEQSYMLIFHEIEWAEVFQNSNTSFFLLIAYLLKCDYHVYTVSPVFGSLFYIPNMNNTATYIIRRKKGKRKNETKSSG